jgi:hypothetical protein
MTTTASQNEDLSSSATGRVSVQESSIGGISLTRPRWVARRQDSFAACQFAAIDISSGRADGSCGRWLTRSHLAQDPGPRLLNRPAIVP